MTIKTVIICRIMLKACVYETVNWFLGGLAPFDDRSQAIFPFLVLTDQILPHQKFRQATRKRPLKPTNCPFHFANIQTARVI